MSPVKSGPPLYEVTGLRRVYSRGSIEVAAVDDVSMTINSGELLAIEGSSGSGKSTLLALLGGLEHASHGSIRFNGREMSAMNDRELTALRASEIGFIFQGFNLIPTLTARQNVEAVMAPLKLSVHDQRERAIELLARVGLGSRADHLPSTMSGGEQQRVAVARALANGPRIVLADEPTGNLDSRTAAEVVKLLRSLTDDLGVTIVLVTHDRELAKQAPRRIEMRDGRIVGAESTLPASPFPSPAQAPRLALVPALEVGTDPAPLLDRPTTIAGGRAAVLIGRAAAVIALAGTGVVAIHHTSSPSPVSASNVAAGKAQAQPNVLAGGRSLVATGDPEPTSAAKKVVQKAKTTTGQSDKVVAVTPPSTSVPQLAPTTVVNAAAKTVSTVTNMIDLGGVVSKPTVKPTTEPKPIVVIPTPTPTPIPTPTSIYNPFWPFGTTTGTWWFPPTGQLGTGTGQ